MFFGKFVSLLYVTNSLKADARFMDLDEMGRIENRKGIGRKIDDFGNI